MHQHFYIFEKSAMAKLYFLDHHSACLIAAIFLILNMGMRAIIADHDEDRKASAVTIYIIHSFFFFFCFMVVVS